MKLFASVVLLFCMTMPALAQQVDPPALPLKAKIVLVAPDSARVGELVRLDVTESIADSFQWIIVPDSVDFETYAEGRKAVFSARTPGDFRFIVACAKDGTVDVVTHVVRVIGPPPEPTSMSLAEWVPFWLWQYDLPDKERIALADSFEAIANRADELEEAKDWIEATAVANREILGDSMQAWAPVIDKIGTALLKMAQDGSLMTPEQHAKVWREIATGLRKG